MEIKTWFKGYLAQQRVNCWSNEGSILLQAAIALYDATGDEAYRRFVLETMSGAVAEDGAIIGTYLGQTPLEAYRGSRALFFALAETGEERYRRAIDHRMQQLWARPRIGDGCFAHGDGLADGIWLEDAACTAPFYMAYEMKFGGMEKVADVVQQYRGARRQLWLGHIGLNCRAWRESLFCADRKTGRWEVFQLHATGQHLMGLVDAIELCSEQLYEHYRALVDIFRESLAGVLRHQDGKGLFWQALDHPGEKGNRPGLGGSAMIAYAVFKGVRLGLLDPEKYLPIARRTFAALGDLEAESRRKHFPGEARNDSIGPWVLAYSENLLAEDARKGAAHV